MRLKDLFKSKRKKAGQLKQVQVGNYSLVAGHAHPIQDYLEYHQYYSRNLPRIAKYIETKYPAYGIVDVGANIGDTIALLRSADVNQAIYSIEGEPSFFSLLQKNSAQFSGVSIYETFLGEDNHTIALATEVHRGTARLSRESENKITVKKLDELIAEKGLKGIKLLKIDTDGYDFKILRGGLDFIKEQSPVLFFEYDAAYLEEQGENGVAIFGTLNAIGYNKIVYYDNYGKLLLSTTLNNTRLLDQLYAYMRKKEGAFPYYDVCVFHASDNELADEVIAKEMNFYN